MKHISNNHITSISAGSYTQNFEPSYLLDEHPKRLWKASSGINIETLTAEISYGCSDIAIFGTNAVSASVSVYDPNAMEWGDNDVWGGEIGDSIPAIDKIVASSANIVDVFIYDTKKDSDGGVWIDSATTQSWYTETLNTATRGTTRPFPAIALIITETDKVTIYDVTDIDCPMWKVFVPWAHAVNGSEWWRTSRNASSATMLNGILSISKDSSLATSDGISFIAFIADNFGKYGIVATASGIASPISIMGTETLDDSLPVIVDIVCNDVAMTVLQSAPIDSETGIKVPTIAVATDGNATYSTSIITDNGDVYDIASDSTGTAVSISFDGPALSVVRSDGTVYVWNNVGAIAADGVSPDATYTASSIPALLGTAEVMA